MAKATDYPSRREAICLEKANNAQPQNRWSARWSRRIRGSRAREDAMGDLRSEQQTRNTPDKANVQLPNLAQSARGISLPADHQFNA